MKINASTSPHKPPGYSLGAEGRRFESLRPDQHKVLIMKAILTISATHLSFFYYITVVDFLAAAASLHFLLAFLAAIPSEFRVNRWSNVAGDPSAVQRVFSLFVVDKKWLY
jgi:hypothetical protein